MGGAKKHLEFSFNTMKNSSFPFSFHGFPKHSSSEQMKGIYSFCLCSAEEVWHKVNARVELLGQRCAARPVNGDKSFFNPNVYFKPHRYCHLAHLKTHRCQAQCVNCHGLSTGPYLSIPTSHCKIEI